MKQKRGEKRVKGYPFDKVRKKQELILRTYEYDLPFNYPNIDVDRKTYHGSEFHGMELLTGNPVSATAELTRVTPGKWTRMQMAFVVPSRAVKARFCLSVAEMSDNETLWVADAFAGVVSNTWNQHDDIPKGTVNLIANPTFASKDMPPAQWKIVSQKGRIERETAESADRASLRLRKFCGYLCTEIEVKPDQRLVYSLWVKSTNRLPEKVVLFRQCKNEQERYISDIAGDCIIITEDEPIVRVAVIGSACTPPGYVMLEAEPCEEFYRGDFVKCTAPVRFKQTNLWGMHLRYDQWATAVDGNFKYEEFSDGVLKVFPFLKDMNAKTGYREHPLTGMSCAVFEIPRSRKVTISGGSETPHWQSDNYPNDDHYSFRTIRTTVVKSPK